MRKSYRDDNGEKIYRYSIRKYHFGAASVAVAALMFFANGVQAQAPAVSPVTASDVVAGPSGNSDGDPQDSDEESPEKTAVVEQPVELKSAGESSAPEAKTEEGSQEESEAEVKSPQPETKIDENAEVPQVTKEKDQEVSAPVADTSAAKSTQSTLEALLANLTLDSMKALHTEVEEGLAKAKAVLENPKATQAQVDEQVKLMEDLTRRVKEALSPQVSTPPVLEKAGLTNTRLATPEGTVLTPKEAVTKVLEKNPVASTNGEVRTPSTKLSKSEVSDNQNKEKLKTISKDLSAYLIQANEITRPETKKLLEGVEEIVKSIEASVLQPQLTPAEIEELLKKGKQAEKKLALALTREKSGKRDLRNSKPMKSGSDFRANPTGLNTKRAYIVQNGDGSDLPAETYLYAMRRGTQDKLYSHDDEKPVEEALKEAKITVKKDPKVDGDYIWTVTFNTHNHNHQHALYWFTLPKGHTMGETLGVTRQKTGSRSLGGFNLDTGWRNKIKEHLEATEADYGDAKHHHFTDAFDSVTDVTDSNFIIGSTGRVQTTPDDSRSSNAYYYLGPAFHKGRRTADWSTAISDGVKDKAKRNLDGLKENTDQLYYLKYDGSGIVTISYKTHTDNKYAPLYYAAGMRSYEYSSGLQYFMARGLQEKPNAPTVAPNNDGTVTVTPYLDKDKNKNVDKVELSYTNNRKEKKTVTLERNPKDGTWTSSGNGADGIQIDGDSFSLKAGKVQVGTEVTAKSYFGNSDASDERTQTIRQRTATPTVTANNDGSVTVTPSGNADYLTVKYIEESNNQKTEITANKQGSTWTVTGGTNITIDKSKGTVTIPANSVVDNSIVEAQAQAKAVDEFMSDKATATAKNEDRTPPTISVKDGTTWKQGNSNGELTLLADQVKGEIKLNVKIEDNQGGSGFGEFSVVGDNKTVDYSISGGSYNGGSTIFSAFGKDSDATALLTLRLNKKTNGEYDYPSTGFTVTIKARDNSPRQNWTTESSTPKLLKVIVKPRDVVSPTVKLKNPTDSNKESVLSDSEQNAPVVTVFRGAKFDVPLKVSDNGENGTVNLKAESGLPKGVSLQGDPVVKKTGATEGHEATVNISGKVAADASLGEHVVTLKVSDDGTGSVDKGNKATLKFKVKVVDLEFENRGTEVNATTRADVLGLGENSVDPNNYLRTTDGENVHNDSYFPSGMKFRYLNGKNLSETVSFDKIGKHSVKARAYFPDDPRAKELPTNPNDLTGDTSQVAGRGYLERTIEFNVRPNAPTLTDAQFYGTAGRRPDVTVSGLPTDSQLQNGASVTVELYQGDRKVASKIVSERNGSTTFSDRDFSEDLTEGQQVHAVVKVVGNSNSYTVNSNNSNSATVTGRVALNNLAEGKKIVQVQDLNRNGVLSEAEKNAIKNAILEANKNGVLQGKSVNDINISATGLITAVVRDNKVAELQIDPKTGVVTRFAHIRDDYNISFPSGTNGKIRPTDPGFEWSADGKSLIYKFDATAGDRNAIINTNDILKKLTATPKTNKATGQPSLAVVHGTDKANGEGNRDNYRRDGSTGYFYHNNSSVNMLDIVDPSNYGGNVQVDNTANKLVAVNRKDINNGNIVGTTLGSDTISAANGAQAITFNNVVKKADGKSLIVKQQLYLMPKYTSDQLLKDRGTTNADNTNVINVYFVPVDPTKPDVTRSTTNNLSTTSAQANRLAENTSFKNLAKVTDNYDKDDATNATTNTTTNTVRSKLNMWVKTGNTKTLIVENGVEKTDVITRLKKEVNPATYEVFAKTTDASGNKSHGDNSDGQSLGFFRVGYNLVARQTINVVRGESISAGDLKTFIQVREGNTLQDLPQGATVTAALETNSIRNGKEETKTVEATVNFGENRTQKVTLTYKVLNTFPIARTLYDFKNPDTARSGGSSVYYHNGGTIPDGMTWIYKGSDNVEKRGDDFSTALSKDSVGSTSYTFGGKYNYGRFTNSPTTGNLEYTERVVHKVFDITDSNGVTVDKGAALTVNQAEAAVKKVDGSDPLPEGTTYEWVGSTDTNTPGVRTYKVRVTLPASQSGTEAQPAATQAKSSKTINVTVRVKPTAPTVTPNNNGDVTVTPANETTVDKLEVIYTPADTNHLQENGTVTKTAHEATKIVASKGANNKWMITQGKKDGVTINGDTGAITLKDYIVKDRTSVSSTDSAQDVLSNRNQADANNGEQDNPTIGLNNTLVGVGKTFDFSLGLSDDGVGVDDSNIKVTLPTGATGLTYDSAKKSIKGTLNTVTKQEVKVTVLDKNGNKAEKTISIAAVKPKPIYAIKDSAIPNVATASKFVEVPTGVTNPSVAWKDGQPTTTTVETTHKTVTVSAQGYTSTEVEVPVTVYPKVTYRKVGGTEVKTYHEIVDQPLTSRLVSGGGTFNPVTPDYYIAFEGGAKPEGTRVEFEGGAPADTSTTAGITTKTIKVTYPNGVGSVTKEVTFRTYGNEANYETGKNSIETTVGTEFSKLTAKKSVKLSDPNVPNPDKTFIGWYRNGDYTPENKIGKRNENVNVWYGYTVKDARGDGTNNYNDQNITVNVTVKPQAPTIATDAFHGKGATKPAVTVSNIPTANQLEENAKVTVELYQGGNKVASKELSRDEVTNGAGSVHFDTTNYTSNLTLGEKVHAVVKVAGGSGNTAYDLSSANSNDVQVTPQKPTFDATTVTSTSRTLSGTLGGFDDANKVVEVHLNDEKKTVLSSTDGRVTITGDKWTAKLPDNVKLRQSVAKNGETAKPSGITVENKVAGTTISTTSDAKEVSMGSYSVTPTIAGSKHIDITVPHDAKRVELRFHNNQETGDKPNGITLVRGADGTWHTDATRADNATVTDANGYVGTVTSIASKSNPAESVITIPLNEESNGKKLHIREEAANGDNTATYGKGLGLRVEYQPEAGQDPMAAGNWKVANVTNTAPVLAHKGTEGTTEANRKVYDSGTTLTADLLKELVTVTDAEDNATDTNNKPYGSSTIEIVSGLTETPGKATAPGIYTVTLKATDSQGRESNELTVYVEVRKQKDENDPTPKEQTVDNGDTPKAKDSISNVADLPENTRIEWKETPTTTEKGNHDAVVVVTYPDGTSEEVPVTITVKETNINGVPEVQPVLPEFNGGVNGGPETQEELPKFNGGVNTPDSPIHERPDFAGGVNGELPDPAELPKVQLIITKWIDENGNELKPADAKAPSVPGEANEAYEHGEIEGYVFVRTETKGDVVTHIFRKVSPVRPTSDSQQRPTTPSDDTNPRPDTATPAEVPATQPAEQPSQTVEVPTQLPNEVSETDSSVSQQQAVLPNTGTKADRATGAFGVLSLLGAFGLLFAKKKKDDEEEA
ncbi:Rib/alpha-like domain-containing protein [Streptococcus sp. 3109]|uniref:Rib/alpha-like domain-containing protein n=1 Tax=Streptococcus sp. 3109 TaxID=2582662 RepID=UPI001564B7D4|nr:Rib/alpha-like domain-containing protein [Streptococcus sp. 3109]